MVLLFKTPFPSRQHVTRRESDRDNKQSLQGALSTAAKGRAPLALPFPRTIHSGAFR
jgi:hypothetical protein